jgi:predicted nucleic acid-binding Zn ribbon protein
MAYIKKEDRRKPIKHFHCLVCGGKIDPARVISKRVLTCSNEHARILTLERRRLRGLLTSRCRLCNRPSSAEERTQFSAWRRDQAKLKRQAEAAKEEKKQAAKPSKKAAPPPDPAPLEKHLGTIAVQ